MGKHKPHTDFGTMSRIKEPIPARNACDVIKPYVRPFLSYLISLKRKDFGNKETVFDSRKYQCIGVYEHHAVFRQTEYPNLAKSFVWNDLKNMYDNGDFVRIKVNGR